MSVESVIKQIESLTQSEKQQVQDFIMQQNDTPHVPSCRVPNLHPDSMKTAPDFDAPLGDEFWLGES